MMKTDELISFFHSYKFFWFSVCGLFILNTAFYSLFIRSQQANIESLQNIFTQKRRQASGQDLKIEGIEQIAIAIDDLAEFRKKLPDRKSLSIQVGELYKVLNKYPISAGKISFKPEKDATLSMWRYSADLAIKGEYPALKKALADIQSLYSIFAIESLTFSKGSGKSDKLVLKLRIVMYLT